MSSKGQQKHARQPVARVKGRETTSQSRHPTTIVDKGRKKPSAPRQNHGGPATPMHQGIPLFKLSRREQEQQQLAAATRKPSYQRDSNGDVNGNVVLNHEQQFGHKNAATPHRTDKPATTTGRQPRANNTHVEVNRAKKLRLRSPSQDIQEKAQRLREVRVDLNDIEPVRLQKALAASGVGSRRDMEEWIEAGLVTINGKVAGLGDKVGPHDRVVVKGDAIKLKWPDRLPRVIMYHKEEGEIVSRDDPEGRVTVFDRLPQAKSSRWVAIGRLDANTSGLLLLTTSGELANRMMHPSFEVEREYSVRVLGELTPEIMKQMISSVPLEDGEAHFERMFQQSVQEDSANKWFNVVIKEGRNREVRRIFEHFGLTVSRLMRVRFGNLGLPPRLKRGQFYELNSAEVAAVMKWSGLSVTGAVDLLPKKRSGLRTLRRRKPD